MDRQRVRREIEGKAGLADYLPVGYSNSGMFPPGLEGYVVTEHGIATLRGKTPKECAGDIGFVPDGTYLKADTPIRARPMTSFCISVVPSGIVIARASRK